jgi:hypothetical protein
MTFRREVYTQALTMIYVIAIFVILIIVFYLYMRKTRLNDLVGVYVAPDDFAKELGVSSMTFMVTDISMLGSANGFIIINTTVIPFAMNIPVFRLDLLEVPVTMVYDNADADTVIPSKLMLTLQHGHLILEDDETIYVAAQWVPVY